MGDNVLRINVARGCQSARPGFSNVATIYSMRFTAVLRSTLIVVAAILYSQRCLPLLPPLLQRAQHTTASLRALSAKSHTALLLTATNHTSAQPAQLPTLTLSERRVLHIAPQRISAALGLLYHYYQYCAVVSIYRLCYSAQSPTSQHHADSPVREGH
eukprot:20010-Heterococcus_DN1.PRE.2